MSYCTVINCMDGMVQLPAINYLKERFEVDYVDSITGPGPNLILAQQTAHMLDAIRCIKSRYGDIEITSLWIDENWKVSELPT